MTLGMVYNATFAYTFPDPDATEPQQAEQGNYSQYKNPTAQRFWYSSISLPPCRSILGHSICQRQQKQAFCRWIQPVPSKMCYYLCFTMRKKMPLLSRNPPPLTHSRLIADNNKMTPDDDIHSDASDHSHTLSPSPNSTNPNIILHSTY
jgi:hypothetical protein